MAPAQTPKRFAPAQTPKRLALVIGNSNYANLPPDRQLPRAVLDARLIGDTLARIGFEVIRGENLDHSAMRAALSDFTRRLYPDDLAFLYFAGHGVSFRDENFLLPVDCPVSRPDSVAQMSAIAVPEKDIFRRTDATVVMIVDADLIVVIDQAALCGPAIH